nr:GNAT family N-acetyltransferase [Clostridia bacterium]
MLIRWARDEDKAQWKILAAEVAELFGSPGMPEDPGFLAFMEAKIEKNEALAAVDRRSGALWGMLGFSRQHNRISWLAVRQDQRGRGIGARLLRCALNQLDAARPVSVTTFRAKNAGGAPARALYLKFGFAEAEAVTDGLGNPRSRMELPPDNRKRGHSFHYEYPRYRREAQAEFCPACTGAPMPEGLVEIAELEHAWAVAERRAQGRLFGKCHVLLKRHNELFYDLPEEATAGFMRDVQKVARALHRVTGAVKINYEMHG